MFEIMYKYFVINVYMIQLVNFFGSLWFCEFVWRFVCGLLGFCGDGFFMCWFFGFELLDMFGGGFIKILYFGSGCVLVF